MKFSRPTSDLLVLKHAALPNLLVPSAFLALCMALGLRESVAAGVYALGIGTLAVWLAARGLEQVRVVFDKTAGHVYLRGRTSLRDTHEARFDPDEIARVEVEETRARSRATSKHPLHKLILAIPEGANAGRHRLTLAGIRDRHPPGLAEDITHWLKRNR